MDGIVKDLERKIKRTEGKVIERQREQRKRVKDESYTSYAGWDLGYWEGRLVAYENLLDMMQEGGNWDDIRRMSNAGLPANVPTQ